MLVEDLCPYKCQFVPAEEIFVRIFCKSERIGCAGKSHDNNCLRRAEQRAEIHMQPFTLALMV